MEDVEILTALYQTQTIKETIGTPTLPTSTVVTMKTRAMTTQVTTQKTVACMCHGNKTSVTGITTILVFHNITSNEISIQC